MPLKYKIQETINAYLGLFGDTKSAEINMPGDGDTATDLQCTENWIHWVEWQIHGVLKRRAVLSCQVLRLKSVYKK